MKYTKTHEWIAAENDIGTVGITDYAQKELGDVVYVELPTVGKQVQAGMEIAVLESTKAAADLYSPVSGEIVEVNTKLSEQSDLINQSPLSEGWVYKIKIKDLAEYQALSDTEN